MKTAACARFMTTSGQNINGLVEQPPVYPLAYRISIEEKYGCESETSAKVGLLKGVAVGVFVAVNVGVGVKVAVGVAVLVAVKVAVSVGV